MRPETLEFQALSEAILSARLQTDAGLVDDWIYTEEGGLEARREVRSILAPRGQETRTPRLR